jgi:tetratricopeptide (TPR) repeat protein
MTDLNKHLLDEQAVKHIKDLCSKGYSLYDADDYKSALRVFYQAWMILPKPQIDYEQAGWVLTCIGDTYFRLQQYDQALEAINSAMHCPAANRNPFLTLRQGQCLLKQQDLPAARKALYKAYQTGGMDIFTKEPTVYLDSIRDLIRDQ